MKVLIIKLRRNPFTPWNMITNTRIIERETTTWQPPYIEVDGAFFRFVERDHGGERSTLHYDLCPVEVVS